jgi:hypothetical protein
MARGVARLRDALDQSGAARRSAFAHTYVERERCLLHMKIKGEEMRWTLAYEISVEVMLF